jgi:flagellar motor switch protein FliM
MADNRLLSQREVDALLGAIREGGLPDDLPEQPGRPRAGRAVQNYDFRHPDKFSKEQIRSLHLLHENFARLLGTNLTSSLRGTIALSITSVEQITYGEFSAHLPRPTLLYVLDLNPLPGRAVLEVSLPIAFAIIDRLLGGPGETFAPRPGRQNRELSDIEISLLRGLGDHVTEGLRDAWSGIAALQPSVQDIAFNSELVQAALPNEVCVLVLLEIKVLNSAGTLSLCMPYTLLEPIIGSLSAQALVALSFKTGRKEDPLSRQRTLRQLERVTLPLSAHLGTASVSVADILNLEAGDIICLDTAVNGTLPLLVDGQLRYRVRPGLAGTRLAVRVEEVIPPNAGDLVDTLATALADQRAVSHDHAGRQQ